MPKPVFIICARSASEDQNSGMLSLFELVEKIQLTPIPEPKPGEVILVQWNTLRAYATWMIQDNENRQEEYEYDFKLFIPPDGKEINIGAGSFRFDQAANKPFFRMLIRFEQPLPLKEAGVLRLENRIRKVGSDEWLSQEYPMMVELVTQVAPNSETPTSQSPS